MVVFLALLQIATSGPDTSPPRPITQLVHTRWTAKEGAPTVIYALAQTADGYLWLGTGTGLFHFDGVRFVRRGPHPGERFSGGAVMRLLGARDGSLWIVWGNGMVSRLHDGRATTYAAADGMPATFDVTESATGNVVAGTANGLARWVEGRWEDVSRAWGYPGKECHALWFDREGTLWATTDDRVVYLPPGGRQFIDPGFHLNARQRLTDFAQTTDGAIWMAELSRSAHTVPRVGDHRPLTEVRVGAWTLMVDRKGSLWVGSAGDGLRRVLDPTRIRGRRIAQFGEEAEQFTEKDGLLSDVVNAILEDREGNIWVACGRGIERFREGAFSPIVTPGGVRARFVFASRDTSVWTGAVNVGGLIRLHSANRETIPTRLFPYNLAQDTSGVLWSPTGTAVIGRSHGKEFTRVALSGAWDQFSDLAVDPHGTVWLFDVGFGLVRLSQNRVVRVAPLSDPVDSRGTLFSDREGRIWIRMRTRAAVYDHGRLTLFDVGKIYSFFQDRTGQVWGVGGGGVGKFEGGRWRQMPFPGALNPNVFGVVEDGEGAWWIATMAGVLRLPPGEAERALADTGYSLHYRTFDLLDGLAGVPTYWGFGPVITRSLDGRIWVAGDSGVASLDPRHLPPVGEVPVLIESVHLNGQELDPTAGLEIPPETGNFEIDYTSTSLAMPERVRFRYQLEGADRAWNDVGTRRQAYYTGLGPGRYRFHVIASTADGVWNETGATWSFRVLPAWYQTLWFKAGLVLLLGGIVAASTALMQRERHRRSQLALKTEYEATLAERARIAQELHDTLLQGFAGVTLQLKAAQLALPEQPDVAAETILRLERLARESLREARERVWDMRETELIGNGLPRALEATARERVAGTGIEVSVVTLGEVRRLTRSLEHTALRIGREAVVNAVRHAQPRRIDIHLAFDTTRLRLEVRDDGRGFTPDQSEEAERTGHFGLSGIRDRAARAGGRCEVHSGEGGGTVVALELPLSEPVAGPPEPPG